MLDLSAKILVFLQAEEKRAYFKNLGAEISAERSQNGIEEDLQKIIGVCDKCFTDTENAGKIEEVLNGIVSMLATVSLFTIQTLFMILKILI